MSADAAGPACRDPVCHQAESRSGLGVAGEEAGPLSHASLQRLTVTLKSTQFSLGRRQSELSVSHALGLRALGSHLLAHFLRPQRFENGIADLGDDLVRRVFR